MRIEDVMLLCHVLKKITRIICTEDADLYLKVYCILYTVGNLKTL